MYHHDGVYHPSTSDEFSILIFLQAVLHHSMTLSHQSIESLPRPIVPPCGTRRFLVNEGRADYRTRVKLPAARVTTAQGELASISLTSVRSKSRRDGDVSFLLPTIAFTLVPRSPSTASYRFPALQLRGAWSC